MNDTTEYGHPGNADFKPTGQQICWKKDGKYPHQHFTNVFEPSDEAKNWDAANVRTNAAIGTRAGYAYVKLEKVGKTLTKIPYAYRAYGYRGWITLNLGTFEETRIRCWFVEKDN